MSQELLSIVKIEECWFFQISRILKLRQRLGGYFGWYSFDVKNGKVVDEAIKYIHIKPLLWRWVLWHERGHSKVLEGCTTQADAIHKTIAYDNVTCHGLMQPFYWIFK